MAHKNQPPQARHATLQQDTCSMEIDAVVTWVDGADPAHRQKRRHLEPKRGRRKPEINAGLKESRFIESGEIRFCLRSIRANCPWIRHIYLVTDNQCPAFLDPTLLSMDGIVLVDHKQIFAGHESFLPSFNSLSIETMLWRIDGLSDNFLYFNDDFFCIKPCVPGDFFTNSMPVIRAKTLNVNARKTVQMDYLKNAADFVGWTSDEIVWPLHTPYPMTRSVFETMAKEHPERFFANAQHRFRTRKQFSVIGLYYLQQMMRHDLTVAEKIQSFELHMHKQDQGGGNAVRKKLESQLARANVKFLCLNDMKRLQRLGLDMDAILEPVCGPPLKSEVEPATEGHTHANTAGSRSLLARILGRR